MQGTNSKIIIASKIYNGSLQGALSTIPKPYLCYTNNKPQTVQKYNRRHTKVHAQMRPNTQTK